MNKNIMNVIKGIGTGMIAGIIVGLVGSQMLCDQKKVKKKAGKAMHAIGDIFDNVQYMFK